MENEKKYTAARVLMKINKLVFNIEKIFLVIIMYGVVAVLFINVLFRFVFFIPSAWADELSRFMFTWLVMLGSATAMYRWEHIDINLIDTIIEKAARGNQAAIDKAIRVVKKFAVICSVAFLIYLFVVYGQYLKQIAKLGTQSMFLGCSLVVPMSAIYVCSGLMIFHGLCYLIIPESVMQREG
ncbi:MAG: TRAP transporter small permease [Oscillospiraceae bacterium]